MQLIYLYVSIMQKIDRHLTCMHTYIYIELWRNISQWESNITMTFELFSFFFSVDNMTDSNTIKQNRQEIPPLMDNLFQNILLLDKTNVFPNIVYQIVIVKFWRNKYTCWEYVSYRETGDSFFSFILIDNKQMIRLFSACWQKLTLKSSMIFTRRDSIVRIYTGQLTT